MMKQFSGLLLLLLLVVGCSPEAVSTPSAPEAEGMRESADSAASVTQNEGMEEDETLDIDSAIETEMAMDGEDALSADSYYYGSQFQDTAFVNNAPFPDADATTMLMSRPYPEYGNGTDIEWAKDIASRLGFTGPIYQENVQFYAPAGEGYEEEYAAHSDAGFPTILVAFEGNQRLTFHESGFSLTTNAGRFDYVEVTADTQLPLDQLIPKAESFLGDAGLLPSDYMAKRGWGNQVQILPVINGLSLQSPLAFIAFDNDGELQSMEYTNLEQPTPFEEREMVSAQAAYELLLENPDRFTYEYFDTQSYSEPPFPEPQFWQREIVDGQPITMSLFISSYLPVSEEGAPLVFGNEYQLIADDGVISELSSSTNPILVRGVPNGVTFAIESWQPIDLFEEPYVDGEVERTEDGVWLITFAGNRLRILDAPDGIETGMQVGMEIWSIENDEINWAAIFEQGQYFGEPEILPVDPDFEESNGIETIVFSEIGQVYTYFFLGFETDVIAADEGELVEIERQIEQNEIFAIHWAFSGVTDKGEDIVFYVPAVEMPPQPEFGYEPPPPLELPVPETE